jgi:hypothetical protein
MDMEILWLPIDVGYTSDFPIVQYDDDTMLIMEASPQQLFVLKAIFSSFPIFTGLKLNYAKSQMIPINASQERIQHLDDVLVVFRFNSTSSTCLLGIRI